MEVTTTIAITTTPYIYNLHVHNVDGELKLFHEGAKVGTLVLQGDTLVRVYDFVDESGVHHEVVVSDTTSPEKTWDRDYSGGYSWKEFAGDQGQVDITVKVSDSKKGTITIKLDPPPTGGGITEWAVLAPLGSITIVATTRIMMQGTPSMRNQIMLNQTAYLTRGKH